VNIQGIFREYSGNIQKLQGEKMHKTKKKDEL